MNIKKKVVAIIRNPEGKILVGRYSCGKNSWTLPKGGIEQSDKNIIESLYREIGEELKLQKSDFNLLKVFDEPYIKKSSKEDVLERIRINGEKYNYIEAHYFGFLLDFIGNEDDIDITFTGEFSDYKWVEINELRNLIYNVEMFDYFKKYFEINEEKVISEFIF